MTPIPRTVEDLVARCLAAGIVLDVPWSLLEAEAVWRGVALETVLVHYLAAKLKEVDGGA